MNQVLRLVEFFCGVNQPLQIAECPEPIIEKDDNPPHDADKYDRKQSVAVDPMKQLIHHGVFVPYISAEKNFRNYEKHRHTDGKNHRGQNIFAKNPYGERTPKPLHIPIGFIYLIQSDTPLPILF